MEFQGVDKKMERYSTAINDLEMLKIWWFALRQIQALLRKPGLGNDKKLLNERERLIDRLGMRHLLLNSSSVHEKIKMDHGAWATTGATNDTLPVIVTSRRENNITISYRIFSSNTAKRG